MTRQEVSADLVLTESKTMRSQFRDRVDALDKVGALALIDGESATTEQVATFFKVPAETIKSVVEANREEIVANGYRVIDGEELRSLKGLSGMTTRARSLALFPRTAILNVGQLLTGSTVAKAVRKYRGAHPPVPLAGRVVTIDDLDARMHPDDVEHCKKLAREAPPLTAAQKVTLRAIYSRHVAKAA